MKEETARNILKQLKRIADSLEKIRKRDYTRDFWLSFF